MNLFIVLLLNLWKFEKLGLVCVFSLSLLSLNTLICFQLTDDDLSAFRAIMLMNLHYLMHILSYWGFMNRLRFSLDSSSRYHQKPYSMET